MKQQNLIMYLVILNVSWIKSIFDLFPPDAGGGVRGFHPHRARKVSCVVATPARCCSQSFPSAGVEESAACCPPTALCRSNKTLRTALQFVLMQLLLIM